MKEFRVQVKDRTYAIAMEPDRMTVDGFNAAYEVVKAAGNHFTVAIDGIYYDVELREGDNGRQIAVVDGKEYPVEALGLTRGKAAAKKAAKPAAAAGPVEGALMALMPSKVITVNVKVGDQVQEGQVCLVLEAMKMESELKATKAGVVKMVNCAKGDSVNPGVPLVVIE